MMENQSIEFQKKGAIGLLEDEVISEAIDISNRLSRLLKETKGPADFFKFRKDLRFK